VSVPSLDGSGDSHGTGADEQQQAANGGGGVALRKRAGVRRTLNQAERENSVAPTVIYLLGAPGCGKHVQSSRIVREFGFVELNVEELALAESKNKSGSSAALLASLLGRGGAGASAIPTDLAVSLVTRAIQDRVHHGASLYFLVTNFPRHTADKEALDRALENRADAPFAIYLEAPQSVCEARLTSRALSQGIARASAAGVAEAQAQKKAFAQFAREGIDAVNAFGAEGRLHVVDATRVPDDVYEQVRALLVEL
jgi:UMP-CMP kinase